jgi:hypothetical protein
MQSCGVSVPNKNPIPDFAHPVPAPEPSLCNGIGTMVQAILLCNSVTDNKGKERLFILL